MKGGPPAPQLSSEIQPVHQLFRGEEELFLESWYLYGASANVAPVAAQVGSAQLQNPANSGVLVVVEKCTCWFTAVTQEVDFSINLVPSAIVGGVATVGFPRDTRGSIFGAAAIPSFASVVANNTLNIIERIVANTGVLTDILLDRSEIVLAPGGVLRMTATAANINLGFTFWWRERSIEEGELK
jgi:hypothetical protein